MKTIVLLLLCLSTEAQIRRIFVKDGYINIQNLNDSVGIAVRVNQLISIEATSTNMVTIKRVDNTTTLSPSDIRRENGLSYSSNARAVRDSLQMLVLIG